MFTSLIAFVSTSGFSALTGLVGGWLAKREERKLAQINNQHEKDMAAIDRQAEADAHTYSLALADKQHEIAQTEGEINQELADTNLVAQTIKAQAKHSGVKWVDGTLRFVRPVITVYMLVLLSFIGYNLHILVGGFESLDEQIILKLYLQLVTSVINLTFLCVGWWFGARGGNLVK